MPEFATFGTFCCDKTTREKKHKKYNNQAEITAGVKGTYISPIRAI